MKKGVVQLYTKNNEVLFSLAWNIFFDNLEILVLKFFGDEGHGIFEPKS